MSVFKSATLLNRDGRGGAQASLTSGFIVAAGARLCPIVFPRPTVDPGGTSAGLQEAIVRGYLVAARRRWAAASMGEARREIRPGQ